MSATDLEKSIYNYLADLGELKLLLKGGNINRALFKLATIESSLHTTLAIEQLRQHNSNPITEHINYSDHALPSEKPSL